MTDVRIEENDALASSVDWRDLVLVDRTLRRFLDRSELVTEGTPIELEGKWWVVPGHVRDAEKAEIEELRAEVERLREGMRSARKTWFEKALTDRAEIEKLRAALVRIDGEASQGAPNSLIEEIAQKALNGGDDE